MFQYNFRVYYEDTDGIGIVYYANYLKFAERARTEMLRELGIEQFSLKKDHDLSFVVKNIDVDFKKYAKLDDLLSIKTEIIKLNLASMILDQYVYTNNEEIIKMSIEIVAINKDFKPVRILRDIYEIFQSVYNKYNSKE